jgi:type II secretory pathway component PulF
MSAAGYSYRAARADGRLVTGRLGAASREGAVDQLARQGLMAVELVGHSGHGLRMRADNPAELALVLRMLSDLLGAGLPLARALGALERLAPDGWRSVLPDVRQSVREGRSLARALSDTPLSISPMVIGIVQGGERGGGLAASLGHAAEICEEHAATRAAIRNALAYPLILVVSGTAAVALLVGVVLPKFAAILADLGQSLPATTRLVLAAAGVVRSAALPACIAAVLIVIAWRSWTARDVGRRSWHAILLGVPVVGEIRHASATARVCIALSALLESGVPIAPALAHAGAAAGDAELAGRLAAARTDVEQGKSLSQALRDRAAFTETARQLVQAGEEAGTLPSLLRHAARLERERSTRQTRAAVAIVEPVLILSFGVLVALVAAALLQALYSVRPA